MWITPADDGGINVTCGRVATMSRFVEELPKAERSFRAGDLVRLGVSRRVLEGPRWVRTGHGLYRRAGRGQASPTQRILDAVAGLPNGATLGGWAAAYALGADSLDGLDAAMRPLPVPIVLPPGLHRQSTAVIRYVQHARRGIVPRPARMVAGIPATEPVQTALDLARWAPDVVEAVVALDALLQARVITPAAFEEAELTLHGARGARQARQAIGLSRPGVLSPWESRLRMFCVLELELPTPLVYRPVFDLSGRFLGTPDLLDEEAGLALEYDGARWLSERRPSGHRDPDQHREDNVREELLERVRLIVVRADKVDLTKERRRLAQRVRSAREEGLRRDRRRDRWTTAPPPNWYGRPA